MLKIALMIWDNNIICKILNMEETLRGRCDFTAKNGISIHSCTCPAIDKSNLFIWGNNSERDNSIISYHCKTRTSAFKYAKKIIAAVNEFNKKSGYKDECVINIQNPFLNSRYENKSLKINILKWENSLIIQVVDIKNSDRNNKCIYFDNFTMQSRHYTSALSNALFVSGDDIFLDKCVAIINFKTYAETQNYIEKVIEGTKIWNNTTENHVKITEVILR